MHVVGMHTTRTPWALPHTAARTVATHCRTLPSTLPHTAMSTAAHSYTATHALPHCHTLPNSLPHSAQCYLQRTALIRAGRNHDRKDDKLFAQPCTIAYGCAKMYLFLHNLARVQWCVRAAWALCYLRREWPKPVKPPEACSGFTTVSVHQNIKK